MDISKLRAVPSNHDRAVKQLQREKVEKALQCPKCNAQNRPGARYIDIDDHDDAYCAVCAYGWQVNLSEVQE